MRAVLSKRAARKSILATFTKSQTRHLPLLAEIAYVGVNELSMSGRNHDCIPAFIEPLRSSKHRVSVSRPLLPPAPHSPVGRHAAARLSSGARVAENLPPASEARASGFPFLPCARKRLAGCDRQRGSAQGGARKAKEVPDGKQGDYHNA